MKIEKIQIQKKKIDLQKEKILMQEQSLKLKERKERTRKLIEIGGLIAKAKLDHLEPNTLLGAFLHIKEKIEADQNMIAYFRQQAGASFSDKKSEKVPVVVKFEEEPNLQLRQKIRLIGLRWNTIRQEWEGKVIKDQLTEILDDVSIKFNVEFLNK